MKDNNFAPTPWKVVPPSAEYPSRAMVCSTGSNIYDAPLTNETDANAHLIAAAPDLYVACKLLEPYARKMIAEAELGSLNTKKYPKPIYDQAVAVVAAIEKAEAKK